MNDDYISETRLGKQLRDRTTLRYMGNCKCGKCQLVPKELLGTAADEIDRLIEMLERVSHLGGFRHLCELLPEVRSLLVRLGTTDQKVLEMHAGDRKPRPVNTVEPPYPFGRLP